MSEKIKHAGEGDIRGILEGENFRRQIMRVLPKHLPPDRFIRIALTAMQRTPKLKDCTPASFFNALLSLSELGIEPDGRRAHLIPYGNECQLIIDYKGYVDLITRPGKGNDVSTIYSDVVREHDDFLFNRGIVERHIVDIRKAETERGKVIGAYTIIRFKNGDMKCEVMSVEDLDRVKGRSKAKDNGPWRTDENEMQKKTVLRRCIKTMPINDQTAKALEVDYDRFEPICGSESAKANPPQVPLKDGMEFKAEQADPPATPTTTGQPAEAPAKEDPKGNPGAEQGPPDESVFDALARELTDYCEGDEAAMQEKLLVLTAFPEMKKDPKTNKYTKEPTGRTVPGVASIADLREKNSIIRAGIALQKLRDEVAKG
jgi:recombination protein RecT